MKSFLKNIFFYTTCFLILIFLNSCSSTNQTEETKFEKKCRNLNLPIIKIKTTKTQFSALFKIQNLFDEKAREQILRKIIFALEKTIAAKPTKKYQYCQIIIRDNTSGIETRYIYNIKDIHKKSIKLISFEELKNREIITTSNNLSFLGRKKIKQFLDGYFYAQIQQFIKVFPMTKISKKMLNFLLENKNKNINYKIISIREKALNINNQKFLVKIEANQSGRKNNQIYKFAISSESYLNINIDSVMQVSEKDFADTQYCKEDFYIKEINKTTFIALLLKSRLNRYFNWLAKKEKKSENIAVTECFFEKNGKITIVCYTKEKLSDKKIDMFMNNIKTHLKNICRTYNYKYVKSVELVCPSQGIIKKIKL